MRVRRTDDPSAHLLLSVTPTTSDSRPLDLKLVATEHEHLYHGGVTSGSAASLRGSNNRASDTEWRDVLAYALLRERSEANSSETLQGLEIVAVIAYETCTITIRKNIGGVTQRLGSIKLDQDDEREEVLAFEWVDSAVAASDDLRSQLDKLQVSFESQKDQVTSLTSQLDELVKAKKEHEDQLLQKFAALLNAKKLKIRDQQRLLNGAQVKSDAAAAVGQARNGTSNRAASASGRGKRRAQGLSPEEEEETALDPAGAVGEDEDPDDDALALEEEEGQQTPEEESTADDASEDDGFAPLPAMTSRTTASQKSTGKSQEAGKGPGAMDVDEPQEPPPKRELPFNRKKEQKQKTPEPAPAPAPAEDNDEDETDDEL